MDQGEGVLGDVGAMLCCSGFLLAVFTGYHPLFSRNQQQYAVGMMPLQQPNSQIAKHEHVNQTSISQTNMTQPNQTNQTKSINQTSQSINQSISKSKPITQIYQPTNSNGSNQIKPN